MNYHEPQPVLSFQPKYPWLYGHANKELLSLQCLSNIQSMVEHQKESHRIFYHLRDFSHQLIPEQVVGYRMISSKFSPKPRHASMRFRSYSILKVLRNAFHSTSNSFSLVSSGTPIIRLRDCKFEWLLWALRYRPNQRRILPSSTLSLLVWLLELLFQKEAHHAIPWIYFLYSRYSLHVLGRLL